MVGFRADSLGALRVETLRALRVAAKGFCDCRVWGLGFRVWGLGFGV